MDDEIWDATFNRVVGQLTTVIDELLEIHRTDGNAERAIAAAEKMRKQWEDDETWLFINARTRRSPVPAYGRPGLARTARKKPITP